MCENFMSHYFISIIAFGLSWQCWQSPFSFKLGPLASSVVEASNQLLNPDVNELACQP